MNHNDRLFCDIHTPIHMTDSAMEKPFSSLSLQFTSISNVDQCFAVHWLRILAD